LGRGRKAAFLEDPEVACVKELSELARERGGTSGLKKKQCRQRGDCSLADDGEGVFPIGRREMSAREGEGFEGKRLSCRNTNRQRWFRKKDVAGRGHDDLHAGERRRAAALSSNIKRRRLQ